MDNPQQQIKIITRSSEQYSNSALLASGIKIEDTEGVSHISLEGDLEDRTIQDFQNSSVVFDDI